VPITAEQLETHVPLFQRPDDEETVGWTVWGE
jgi:hypothetical protein